MKRTAHDEARPARARVPGKAAIALGLVGFLWSSGALAQVYDVKMTLPSSVQVQDVVLGTADNLRVETFANVEGGTHSRIVNMGNTTASFSFGAKTGDILSVANVSLLEIPNISGSVTSEGTVSVGFGTTVGKITQHAQLGRKVGPSVHAEFPALSGVLNVLPLTTQTLSPGAYGTLNVSPGGTLKLRSGVYYFDNYIVDPLSTVVVDESAGPVEIYVKTSLQHMGNYKTPSNGPPNVFVGFFGMVPAYIGASYPGTVVAPNTLLVIGTNLGGTTHLGSFFAWGIEVLPATTIKHRASDYWGTGGLTAIATRASSSAIIEAAPPSPPPSFTGTTQTTNGTTYVTGIHALPSNPATGVVAPQFCDANDNPVTTPTDAQLNAAPPPGSTCPAIAADTTNCPIDPATVTTKVCVTDSDCGAGYLCGARCVDEACLNIEHRCGKPAASCGGLPAQTSCQEYYMCPEEGAVGAPKPEDTRTELGPTQKNAGNFTTDAADKTVVPEYQPVSVAVQALCQTPPDTAKDKSDGSNKVIGGDCKKKKWGIYLKPIAGFRFAPNLDATKFGEMGGLEASLGFEFGGCVLKNKIEVVSAKAGAAADSCGMTLVATVKLLGQAVYAWTPSSANANHMAKQNDDSIGTPPVTKTNCQTSRDLVKKTVQEVRRTNLLAREVYSYYGQNGMTPGLCQQIENELGSKLDKDPDTGKLVDCLSLENTKEAPKANMLDAWKTEYDARAKNYLDFSKDLGVKRQAIEVSGTADLKLSKRHMYDKTFVDQDIQISFVTLNIEAEGYGFWAVSSGIQYGLGFSGNFKDSTDLLKNTFTGTPPRVGDIRVYAGPVVTPEAGVGVMVYAGLGVPGLSVGIEGQLDLLTVSQPTGVTVSMARVSEDDRRDRSQSEYTGALKEGLEPAQYHWVKGIRWGSTLTLQELDGRINLAARLHFPLFHKTFRFKLADFKGFTQSFPIISGTTGDLDPYIGADDYGKQGDDVAYTEVAPVGANLFTNHAAIVTNPIGPRAPGCIQQPPLE